MTTQDVTITVRLSDVAAADIDAGALGTLVDAITAQVEDAEGLDYTAFTIGVERSERIDGRA